MTWHGLQHFVAMGGYGLYVWGSYGVTIIVVWVEVVLLRRRLRAARELAVSTARTTVR